MKPARLLLLFVATSAMLLAGCAGPATPDSTSSQSPDPTPTAVEVSVDYATDHLLAAYDSFEEFTEPEGEGLQRIIFTTNVPVEDIAFIEIGFIATDDGVTLVADRPLHTLAELSPTVPFVTTWLEQGTIPHRGIAFVDESGTTRHFYLTMSGEDGSLLLVPLNPAHSNRAD